MSDLYKPRPERWPQVSLRSLFGLLVILAIFFAWAGVQVQWIRERHRALEGADTTGVFDPYLTPAPWNLRLFGELGITILTVEHDQVPEYQRLFPEAVVLEHEDATPGGS